MRESFLMPRATWEEGGTGESSCEVTKGEKGTEGQESYAGIRNCLQGFNARVGTREKNLRVNGREQVESKRSYLVRKKQFPLVRSYTYWSEER